MAEVVAECFGQSLQGHVLILRVEAKHQALQLRTLLRAPACFSQSIRIAEDLNRARYV